MDSRIFVAPNMKAAMRKVITALGRDAVILSSRKVAEGIELTAATDDGMLTTTPRGPADGRRNNPDTDRYGAFDRILNNAVGGTAASPAVDIVSPGRLLGAGVRAFIGPTGSGKTTALARFAAQKAILDGPDSVAIVGLDQQKLGAMDSLARLARLLGVTFVAVGGEMTLEAALAGLDAHKLVLVDSQGYSLANPELGSSLAQLDALGIERILLLPANLSARDLERAARAYEADAALACILSKLDDTSHVGSVVDLVRRQHLRVSHIAHGPELSGDMTAAEASMFDPTGEFAEWDIADLTKGKLFNDRPEPVPERAAEMV